MSRLFFACCLVLALPMRPGSAFAGEFAPGGNSATLARPFALPTLGDATPLPRGRSETRWTFDVTNEYAVEGTCPMECIVVDGETARVRFAWRHGLAAGWEAGLELSWLDRGGGFLDGWIQEWHEAFGLPNGGRELGPQDQYRIRYERAGTVLLEETRGGSGFGDAAATLGWRFSRRSTARAMLKLPTGDDGALEGGNAGAALWLERTLALPPHWHGYAALGVSINDRGAVLPEMQNREVVFGGVGLLAPFTPNVGLTAQLQFNGRLYDGSTLAPLARPGMPLSLGLRVRTGARGAFELGFQEDPSVNGSPDFSAYLSFRSL
jgi:hypothetical protein